METDYQVFIQAIYLQPFSPEDSVFFTVCLVQWLCGVAPW